MNINNKARTHRFLLLSHKSSNMMINEEDFGNTYGISNMKIMDHKVKEDGRLELAVNFKDAKTLSSVCSKVKEDFSVELDKDRSRCSSSRSLHSCSERLSESFFSDVLEQEGEEMRRRNSKLKERTDYDSLRGLTGKDFVMKVVCYIYQQRFTLADLKSYILLNEDSNLFNKYLEEKQNIMRALETYNIIL